MDSVRSIKAGSTRQILMVALASAAMVFAGCSKKVDVTTDSSASKANAGSNAAQQEVQPIKGADASKPATNAVYFAFDSSALDAAGKATLDAYAAWLNANNSASITIEGNCDERGSREYNLALGQRRADSVRDYLAGQGVMAARIDTVSFGEERPVCKGSGEACWAQNRRGDIVSR
ncbi:peptidoglycan-associated lipoprotein Pal [Mariprofundus erugo]|uniref:Peptidoglycan-associated lipoprotein n=2 Tax=Mariprofundus erugo TaxID=2528639 RepID=A0A5R9GJN9_9PROT|nr:peptidoglycan-associated lipoprotein Pal [Mariprofundus erugo]TLS76418.1 peptidoglycan-associated lipoprotein Pal [Mariprofundus erugo]